jgi:hypothetical protein
MAEVCTVFEDYIGKCIDEITVNANVPEGPYILQVVTPMGKVYQDNVVADANGSFVITPDIFPAGLLNEYAGGFQIFLMADECTPVTLNLAHPGETVTTEYDFAFFTVKGGSTTKSNIGCVITGVSSLAAQDIDIPKFNAMGSDLKVQTFPLYEADMSAELDPSTILLAAIQVLQDAEMTGLVWVIGAPGDFTQNGFNGIGLYKHAGGGILNLVAQSADDASVFVGTVNDFIEANFTTPYTAAAGLYFVAFLHSASAVVTPPAAFIHSTIGVNDAFAGLFTDNMKVCGTIIDTTLPATIDMADVTAVNTLPWAGLY